MEKVKIYNTKLHKSRLLAVRLVILYSSNKNKEYNMIISILAKTERCLPLILHEGGIDLKKCQIRDYKSFRDGEKALIIIGDGRVLRHRLQRLVLLNGGRSNFDWCRVWGG